MVSGVSTVLPRGSTRQPQPPREPVPAWSPEGAELVPGCPAPSERFGSSCATLPPSEVVPPVLTLPPAALLVAALPPAPLVPAVLLPPTLLPPTLLPPPVAKSPPPP